MIAPFKAIEVEKIDPIIFLLMFNVIPLIAHYIVQLLLN